MKCGVWLMILLAATFIAWSPYLCETVKAETPQVPKKRTEKLNLDGLPDKNPKKKIDLFSDEKLPPEVKTKERFKLIDDLGIISDEKLPEKVETIVPSVGPSGIHPRFQMITNDMSGELSFWI